MIVEGDRIAELRSGAYQAAAQDGETRVFDLEGAMFSPVCGTSMPILATSFLTPSTCYSARR